MTADDGRRRRRSGVHSKSDSVVVSLEWSGKRPVHPIRPSDRPTERHSRLTQHQDLAEFNSIHERGSFSCLDHGPDMILKLSSLGQYSNKINRACIAGLCVYSDTLGAREKTHCKQSAPSCVTVTSVTEIGRACINVSALGNSSVCLRRQRNGPPYPLFLPPSFIAV